MGGKELVIDLRQGAEAPQSDLSMIIPHRTTFAADPLPKLRQGLEENLPDSGSSLAEFDLLMNEAALVIGGQAAVARSGDDGPKMASSTGLPVQPAHPLAGHVPPSAVANGSAGEMTTKANSPADSLVLAGDAQVSDATKTLAALAFDEQVARGTNAPDGAQTPPNAPSSTAQHMDEPSGQALVPAQMPTVPAQTKPPSPMTAQLLAPADAALPGLPIDDGQQSLAMDERTHGATLPPSGAEGTGAINQPEGRSGDTPIRLPSPPHSSVPIAGAKSGEISTTAPADNSALWSSENTLMHPGLWQVAVSNLELQPFAEGQDAAFFTTDEVFGARPNLQENVSNMADSSDSHPSFAPGAGSSTRGDDPLVPLVPQMMDAKTVAPKDPILIANIPMSGEVPSSDSSPATVDPAFARLTPRSRPSAEQPSFALHSSPFSVGEAGPDPSEVSSKKASEWQVNPAPKPAMQKGEPQMAWAGHAPEQAREQKGLASNSPRPHALGQLDMVFRTLPERASDRWVDPAAVRPVEMRWQSALVANPSAGAGERTSTAAAVVVAGQVAHPPIWGTTDATKPAPDSPQQPQPAVTMSLPSQARSVVSFDPAATIAAEIFNAPSTHTPQFLPEMAPLTSLPPLTGAVLQTKIFVSNIAESQSATSALPIELSPVFATPSTDSGTLAQMSEKDLSRTLSQQVRPELLRLSPSAPDGPVILTLRPQELGTLTFEVRQTEQGLHLHLTVDQPATLDLLRRQGDQLIADLRQAGFAGASLSFAGEGAQNAPNQRDSNAQGRADPTAAPLSPQTLALRPAAISGGLDLRL